MKTEQATRFDPCRLLFLNRQPLAANRDYLVSSNFPILALALEDLVDRAKDEVDGFFLGGLVGLDVDLRSFRGFVRGGDAGELGDLAAAGLGVESLDVA